MTLPGPDVIKECLHCRRPFKQGTLSSFSSFGGNYWTDGRDQGADWIERHHVALQLVKCPECGQLMWISEAKHLGQTEFYNDDARWPGASYYLSPNESDYLDALETNLANDAKKLHYLRVRAWWAANDLFRDDATLDPATVFSGRATSNMKCLYATIDDSNDDQRIMKAELARELGLFDQAKHLLSFPFDREYRHVVKVISDLAEKKERRVAIVHGNEAVTLEEIQAERERKEAEMKARYYAPPWDAQKSRLEQFFSFVCPRCAHREEIGLWHNSKMCSQCSATTVIYHPNETPPN